MEDVVFAPDHGAKAVFIATGGTPLEVACAGYLGSLADQAADGQLLTELAMRKVGLLLIPTISRMVRADSSAGACGVDLEKNSIRIGTPGAIEAWLMSVGGDYHQ